MIFSPQLSVYGAKIACNTLDEVDIKKERISFK